MSLKEETIMKMSLKNRLYFLSKNNILWFYSPEFICKLAKECYEEEKKNPTKTINVDRILDSLTKSQFMKIYEYIPDVAHRDVFLRKWVEINFAEKLATYENREDLNISEMDDFRKIMLNVLDKVEDQRNPKLRRY